MSLTLKQFAGSVVQPADDGALYDFLLSGKSGTIDGMTVTNPSGTNLAVSAGVAMICGRMVRGTAETIAATVPGSEQAGRLILQVDLTNASTQAQWITQVGSTLPALTQEDLNNGGTIYQMAVATYRISSGGITNLVNVNNQLKMGGSSFSKAGDITDTIGSYWSSDNATWSWATGQWNWTASVCGNTINARVSLFCNIGQSGGGTSGDYDIIDMESFFNNTIKAAIEAELGDTITPTLKHLDVVNVQITSFTAYATRHVTVFSEMDWDAVTLGGIASNASDGHSEEAVITMTLTF